MTDSKLRFSLHHVALWLALGLVLLGLVVSPALANTVSPQTALRGTDTPWPTMPIIGTYVTPAKTPPIPIPPPMPTPKSSGDDVVVVMLLGSDTITAGAASRTDVIVLVAIDRTVGSVTMLQIPRDLYVYIPNHSMDKINTVMNTGNVDGGTGGGAKLIADTILYNFGIKVDFYAHVNFVEFQDLIAKLGGLDISVDCAIQDFRLKSPTLEYNDPKSWELYTLPMGYRHLDPYMALWYVRTRASSSDFDRGRREIDVLRAIWREAKGAGLLNQVTTLWPEAQQIVETDMSLQDILGFVPTALSLQPEHIQRIQLQLYKDFTVGNNLGYYALIPKRDAFQTAAQNFVLPPPQNRLNGEAPTVQIGAALPLHGLDQVAADRLAWDGFASTVIGTEGIVNRAATVIYDYTGNAKPSSLQTMMKDLRVPAADVIQQPDPNRTVDFRVEIGHDYANCMYSLPSGSTVTPQPNK
jgi:LCP family protein required for cell wall assembly